MAQKYDNQITSGASTAAEVEADLHRVNITTKTGDGFIGAIITRLQAKGHDVEINLRK